MDRWQHIVAFTDYIVIFHGLHDHKRTYPLTPERLRRLEAVLSDAIEPAGEGRGWLWSWDNWNWHNIGGK